ncbi:hypothetical protein HDV04_006304 [Boothiomyces sp. JEL0838]|nr:hypothetical protein HDV04_006304 [Boothiomyces sp. JEL0838]
MIYVISDEPQDQDQFITNLEEILNETDCYIQIRAKSLGNELLKFLEKIGSKVDSKDCRRILINVSDLLQLDGLLDTYRKYSFGGVHLTNNVLSNISQKPEGMVVAASCHSSVDLERANELELDFVVLSPVKFSTTCPSTNCLGFEKFKELAAKSKIPVYGLGGLGIDDLPLIRENGGVGIAAISSFWHRHQYKVLHQ